jgi:hypothetical protein
VPKLTELDFTSRRQQDVGGLDVAVDLALQVEVLQSEQNLATDNSNLSLGEDPWFQLRM